MLVTHNESSREPDVNGEREMTANYACSTCDATSGLYLVMKLGMDYNDANRDTLRESSTIENWSRKDGEVRQYEIMDIIEDEGWPQAVFDPSKPRGQKAVDDAPDPDQPSSDPDYPSSYCPEWWCSSCGEVTVDLSDLVEKVS